MTVEFDGPGQPVSARPTFEVLAGFHRGVTIVLEDDEYHIGSTAEADIVLRDPGVSPNHAVLRVDRQGVRVEATGAGVGLADGLLPKGAGCRLRRFPAELAIGEARVRVSGGPRRGGMAWDFLAARPLTAAAGAICCLLVFSSLASLFARDDSGFPASQPASPLTPPIEQAAVEDASRQLSEQLKGANLATVRVNVLDRKLILSGRIAPQQKPALEAVLHWFDRNYADRLTLTSTVQDAARTLPPPIHMRAIWYGEDPYIITDEGRFKPHTMLGAGYTLEEIRDDSIVLSKDGETLPVLKY